MKIPYLILSFSLIFSSFSLRAVTIFYDPDRTGEMSMIHGVKAALKVLKPHEPIYEFTDLDALAQREPEVVLTVGTAGFKLLKEERFKGWTIAHMSHQVFEDHVATLGETTIFFLPAYLKALALPEALEAHKEKIIWTNGVAYSLSKEEVQAAYETLPEKLSGIPRVVILGGDTQKTDGSWMPYTKAQAEALATWIAAQSVEATPIIILNGPRTGKHKADGTLDLFAHRGGNQDYVTVSFMAKLKTEKPTLEVTLFDFQYGETSAYRGMLGALLKGGGIIYVPGESNSMIQDMVALSLVKEAVIYRHSAMQPSHQANVDYIKNTTDIAVLDQAFHVEDKEENLESGSENPNIQIAKKLLALLELH